MKYIEDFIKLLQENDKSQNTIQSYVSDIGKFNTYSSNGIECTDKTELKGYISHLQGEGQKVSTINRKIASINSYVKYINEYQGTNIPQLKQLKKENQTFIDDMLTLGEVKRIIKQAEKHNDIRAVTIFYTLLLTGARVSELLQVKVKDIDKDSVTVKGKGSKYRELLIPKSLKKHLKRYGEIRNNESEFLFVGERGEINRQTVHNTIKHYTGQARGISKDKAHAHSFRHLYAQQLAKLGVEPVVISQLLGHSLTVTGLYMQVSKKELLKTINKLDI